MSKPQKFYNSFRTGLTDAVPIALGYFSVSIAFGISAVQAGVPVAFATLISLTNLTSAGQVGGLAVIAGGGSLFEMALTQLIINLRYALMSVSLSQKMHKSVTLRDRFLIAFGNTDEIFAVASGKDGELGKTYMAGLIILPIIGWTSGTFVGAMAGEILPASIIAALGLAIYGMFFAVFIPPMKKSKTVTAVVALAILLSCIFKYTPVLCKVSSGFVIILCAVIAATLGAFIDKKNGKWEQIEQDADEARETEATP